MALRTSLSILLAVFSLVGCRTYGGYGSEAGTLEQIVELPEWAEQEMARLAGDRQALDAATSRRPELEPLLSRLIDLDTALTSAAAQWSVVAGTVESDASYRELNRKLGAMIAERQAWENGYRRLATDLEAAVHGAPAGPRPAARYQVAPVYYERLASRLDEGRIRDLVASIR